MCFSPQRRPIFAHLNFKKCSETLNFLAFWLGNVLLATAACNFSTSQLQKVLWDPQLFSILTWKCASRHSGVQFLNISTSKSAPNLTCTFPLENVLLATAACNFWFLLWPHDSAPAALTSLLFDSPDTRTIEKTQHFATSLTFGAGESSFFRLSRYCIFFLLTLLSADFTSSICFSSAFQLSILSEVYYLNFLRLIRTTNYCSVLWSITPYFIVHSTTKYYKVLLRTTMYYILLGPNKSYKILLRTTKYCCVLQTTTRYLSVLQSTISYYPVLQNTTKAHTLHTQTQAHRAIRQIDAKRPWPPPPPPKQMEVFPKNNGKTPKSSHFSRVFPLFSPSILGAHPYFWKHPYRGLYYPVNMGIVINHNKQL